MYFIHIPKTGGTSVTRALYKRNLLTPYHKRYPIHTSIRDIDHIDFSKPIVTCVRNPYDRFHSLYNFFIKIRNNQEEIEEEEARDELPPACREDVYIYAGSCSRA